jgi:TonB family protein
MSEVERARVRQTTGDAELDTAMVGVARWLRFSPARNREMPVKTWFWMPITFVVPR